MHIHIHVGRRSALLVVGAIVLLVAAGVAYATIPDGNGVYTACRLNGVGTIRLIDPSGPSSSLLSHCTKLETEVSWNQVGQKGDTGAPGVSPTVTSVAVGDSHCPAGGAAITDAAGSTAYVCSGQFTGTLTSPNGDFSLRITDGGVEITGPDAKVSLPSSGGVSVTSTKSLVLQGDRVETVTVGHDRTENIGNDETISVGHDRTETVDHDQTVTVGNNRTETVDNDETVSVRHDRTETVDHDENITIHGGRTQTVDKDETITVGGSRTETAGELGLRAAGALDFVANLVGINSGSVCRPAARVDDRIDPTASFIATGSPTVCIG